MRVYISGPITGVENYKEAFAAAAETIRKQGNVPCNPAALIECLPDGTHEEYMRLSFELLDMCEAIVLLPGWEKSAGACMEYGYAMAMDIMIYPMQEEAG